MAEMRKRKSLEPHCFVVYWRCGCLPRLGREISRGLQSGISHGGVWRSLVGMCKTKAWSIGRKMGEGRRWGRWGRGEDSRGETRLQGKAMAALR